MTFIIIGEIYHRYEAFNFVMMDCGQYDLRWKSAHMTPEQSYQAAKDLHVKNIFLIHWDVYCLVHHPWDDPIERIIQIHDQTVCI